MHIFYRNFSNKTHPPPKPDMASLAYSQIPESGNEELKCMNHGKN